MKYRRLPGKKRSFGRWRTLWMGDDHLLSVDSNGYSEDYTRYYFKDIKAVIARRTAGMLVWNCVMATALAVCLLAVFISFGDGATPRTITMAVLCALLLAGLLVNTLRGPTCSCHILMPLGIHELPTLRRIRTVRRILDRIRPFVVERQGVIVPEDAVARPAPMSVAPFPRDVTP